MFAKYQASPQYRLVNGGMTLADFKGIFWLEYVHRLWGRLIGLVFLVPFLAFLGQRPDFRRAEVPRLVLLFVLGGLQGARAGSWWQAVWRTVPRSAITGWSPICWRRSAIYGALLWSALDYPAHRDRRGAVAATAKSCAARC